MDLNPCSESLIDDNLSSDFHHEWKEVDNPWTYENESLAEDFIYVDLLRNPERYTGGLVGWLVEVSPCPTSHALHWHSSLFLSLVVLRRRGLCVSLSLCIYIFSTEQATKENQPLRSGTRYTTRIASLSLRMTSSAWRRGCFIVSSPVSMLPSALI